jgi:hypothetical protein
LTISPVSPEDGTQSQISYFKSRVAEVKLYTSGPGLKGVIDTIDIQQDFKTFMSQYALSWQMSGQRGPKRDGPTEDGYVRIHFLLSRLG